MRKLIAVLSTLLIAGALASIPSPALAAPPNDFGNTCVATTTAANATVVMTTKSGLNTLPITAPTSGVITKATFNVPPAPIIPTVMKTLRPTGGVNEYTVISQSASINVGTGNVAYDVRLPVTAGDLLGLYSGLGTLMCASANASDVVAAVAGDIQPGSPATYAPIPSRALSAVATIEPDADKDGYGDTTQDLCPQSASFQTACPVIMLDSFAAPSGKSITVVVATDDHARSWSPARSRSTARRSSSRAAPRPSRPER